MSQVQILSPRPIKIAPSARNAGNCFTSERRFALVRSGDDLAGASVVIGTFLILWLGMAPAIWLVWAASFVARLFAGLAARIRINSTGVVGYP